MKRLAVLLALLGAAPTYAATTYYATATGGAGSACTLQAPCTVDGGINKLASGDTLELLAGRYSTDQYYIGIGGNQALNCSQNAPCIVQPYGYTGPFTGDTVYIDGSTSVTWTQCAGTAGSCNAPCNIGTPASIACNRFWYYTGSGDTSQTVGVQKPDGLPTYRLLLASDFSNAHSEYHGDVCSATRWMACETHSDCPPCELCVANGSPEVDTLDTGSTVFILMANGTDNPTSLDYRVFFNGDGDGFFITGSSWLIVRGFTFRAHESSAVLIADNSGACSNITITDNRIYYADADFSSGPDYGIAVYRSNNITVSGNNIGYTTSEGIHTDAITNGSPTNYQILGNWIHNQGDPRLFGPGSHGTPSGMIITNDHSGGGNYAGTVIDGNLITHQRMRSEFSNGNPRGIILEDTVTGPIIRNNIFLEPGAECLKLDGQNSVASAQVYNNLMVGCGASPGSAGGGGTCIYLYANSGNPGHLDQDLIWNNTLYGCANHAIVEDCGGTGVCTGNVIANNILQPAAGKKCISWTNTTSGNLFKYNLCNTGTTNPAATFLNVSKGCSLLTDLGAGNVTQCGDTSFLDPVALDFHLRSTSLALNAGTPQSQPVVRAADIYNTLAQFHGFPSYADATPIQGGTWDIGADERIQLSALYRPSMNPGILALLCP